MLPEGGHGLGIESVLGILVFGPHTDSMEGKAFTINRLREAAQFLEFRFSNQRRQATEAQQLGETPAPVQQQPVERRKRRHRATRAANGSSNGTREPSPPPPSDPLFPPADA